MTMKLPGDSLLISTFLAAVFLLWAFMCSRSASKAAVTSLIMYYMFKLDEAASDIQRFIHEYNKSHGVTCLCNCSKVAHGFC